VLQLATIVRCATGNQLRIPTRARSDTARACGASEVIERVQQFEDGIVRRHRLARIDGIARPTLIQVEIIQARITHSIAPCRCPKR